MSWAILVALTALAQQPPVFVSIPPAASDELRFGAPLPPFEAKDIAGKTWRSDDLRGKFTLIYIWGTAEARAVDNHPHAREIVTIAGLPDLPELQRFYDRVKTAKKIQVLTFCRDYDYTHAPEYMTTRQYTFPVIADWVLMKKLFPDAGPSRHWLVNPEGRLSEPFRSWTFGRLLFEFERVAGRN